MSDSVKFKVSSKSVVEGGWPTSMDVICGVRFVECCEPTVTLDPTAISGKYTWYVVSFPLADALLEGTRIPEGLETAYGNITIPSDYTDDGEPIVIEPVHQAKGRAYADADIGHRIKQNCGCVIELFTPDAELFEQEYNLSISPELSQPQVLTIDSLGKLSDILGGILGSSPPPQTPPPPSDGPSDSGPEFSIN